jgi:hypothetical protein
VTNLSPSKSDKRLDIAFFRVGGNKKVEFVPVHMALLSGHTPKLFQLCSSVPEKSKDPPTEFIATPGNKTREGKNGEEVPSAEAFKSMLRFVYYGDIHIDPQAACELIPFAKDYDMNDLLKVCEDKIRHGINKQTALNILRVTYLPQMEGSPDVLNEVRKNATEFILDHLSDVDLQPLKVMEPIVAIDILLASQHREKHMLSLRDSTRGPSSHRSQAKFEQKNEAQPSANAGLERKPPALVLSKKQESEEFSSISSAAAPPFLELPHSPTDEPLPPLPLSPTTTSHEEPSLPPHDKEDHPPATAAAATTPAPEEVKPAEEAKPEVQPQAEEAQSSEEEKPEKEAEEEEPKEAEKEQSSSAESKQDEPQASEIQDTN